MRKRKEESREWYPYPGREMVKVRCVASVESGRVVGISKDDSPYSSLFLSWLPIIMMASIEQDAFSSYSCV